MMVLRRCWAAPSSDLSHSNRTFQSCLCRSSAISASLEDIDAAHTKTPKVVLKKGKTQIFKTGNPMVYSGAVDRIIGRPAPQAGDAVLVTDGALHPIAWGLYNPVSMFTVRIMEMDDEVSRDSSCVLSIEKLLKLRIAGAMELRARLGLPTMDTSVYRLVNSEGDRLSGLIVDIFGDCAVVASSAAWVEKLRTSIETILQHTVRCKHVCWRPSLEMLKEEGLKPEVVEQQLSADFSSANVIENGIFYKVSLDGQKTGFYADQRENRLWLRSVARNRSVLDVCCYSGGFSLNAAIGGAAEVTGVDSSSSAIELALENRNLNKLSPKVVSFLKADASEYMKEAISAGRTWDIVVLDPPKLAPNRKVLQRAIGMYRNLNTLAMKCVESGGLLMTCSCSGAMTQTGSLLNVLLASATSAGKKITQIRYAGAAADHTIDPSYPEGAYLTNIVVRVA